MRFIWALFLLSHIGINAHCQDAESIAFLHNFFGKSAKVVYTNKLWADKIEHMQEALAQDTLYTLGATLNNPDDCLILTQQERTYVQNEVKLLSKMGWLDQLFENGKMITEATLDSIYKDRARGRVYFKEHYGSKLYSFSKPIFIRDHSLCIFYSGYSCGPLCGEGKLVIFRKKNDTWVPWLELFKWIS